jgi:catechol 2,3-dioxygenase-like lactoylglutathione lyase family enzyme
MPVHRIDHVTLNASDLSRTCDFYRDALGFQVQPMEGYGIKGAWLSLDGHPYVHVIWRQAEQARESRGLVDHFALQATGIAEMRQRLDGLGVAYRENALPDIGVHQIVMQDPDGVKVELNFAGAAALAA